MWLLEKGKLAVITKVTKIRPYQNWQTSMGNLRGIKVRKKD